MYGIRTVSPFVIGMRAFSRKLFMLLNAVSAALWAFVIGCAGYVFGRVIENMLDKAKHLEGLALLGILGCGLAIWIWHLRHTHAKL